MAARVTLFPGGALLAVGGPHSPLDYVSLESLRSRLRVGIGPVGGHLRLIGASGIVATRALAAAVNDRADAAVVFSRCVDTRCSKRSVLATFRRRGRVFAAPVVLAKRTGYPAAAVALNPRDAIVVWIQRRSHGRGNDVRARTRRPDGRHDLRVDRLRGRELRRARRAAAPRRRAGPDDLPPNVDRKLMDLAGDCAGDALAVGARISGTTTAPGVAAVTRAASSTTFGRPSSCSPARMSAAARPARPGPTAARSSPAGPEQVINRDDPPGVRVTQLLGSSRSGS